MRVVDRLIEHLDFTSVVSLIPQPALIAGVESVRSTLESIEPENLVTNAPSSGLVVSMNEALLSFSNMDHTSLLGLGDLDIYGIQEIYAFSDSECTPEGRVGDHEVAGEYVVGEDTTGVVISVNGCVVGGACGGMDDGKDAGGGAVTVGEKVGVESGGGDDEDAPALCAIPPGA